MADHREFAPPAHLENLGRDWAEDLYNQTRAEEMSAGLDDAFRLGANIYTQHRLRMLDFVGQNGGVARTDFKQYRAGQSVDVNERPNMVKLDSGIYIPLDHFLSPPVAIANWWQPAEALPPGVEQSYGLRLDFGNSHYRHAAEREAIHNTDIGAEAAYRAFMDRPTRIPDEFIVIEQVKTSFESSERIDEDYYIIAGRAENQSTTDSEEPDKATEPEAYRQWLLAGTVRTALIGLAEVTMSSGGINPDPYHPFISVLGKLSPDAGQATRAYERCTKLLRSYAQIFRTLRAYDSSLVDGSAGLELDPETPFLIEAGPEVSP